MRNRLAIVTAVACLVASGANAQQPPPPIQPTAPVAGVPAELGSIDLGFRGTDATGDAARYERYRDLRDGAFSRILYGKSSDSYQFDARAENIGYRDQRYRADYQGGQLHFTGLFDSVPTNYGYTTSTPWVEQSPAVLTLDIAARQAVQAKTVVGVPQNVTDLRTPSIYRGIANPIALTQLRQGGGFNLLYDKSSQLGFDASYGLTSKTGHQPLGASFAFNVANEVPVALDNKTHDATAGLEWTHPHGMFRVGWVGSFFTNDIKSLVWDNAFRATDTNPIDPSGYSNGNGAAQGRMAVPPGNSLNSFNALAVYRLAKRTTLNGSVAFTRMSQDDALIPWTSNPVINTPAVFATFPNLAALPRPTAEARADGVNGVLNFNTRPNRHLGLTVRYRYNDHANKTTEFDGREYVRFDAVPEETGAFTERFDIKENLFDVAATFSVVPHTSIRLGYGYDSFDRTGRSFSDMSDHALRASIDTVGNQWVTVRGLYEHVQRKGSGFSESALEDGGSQPGLRFYDESDRDRDRGTLLFSVNPMDTLDVTFSLTAGKDTYKGEGHEFGLLDNDNTTINIGLNLYPTDAINFGANYGRDHYNTNQKSRNANPPPDPQFDDPTRDWTMNNTENVNNFDLFLDLPKIARKTGLRLTYDYSDSDNGFVFGGPRIASLTAANTFIPLPNVTNKWQRLAADVQYFFVSKVGVGLSYWYEKFDVTDFNTIDIPGQPGTPRIDYLGEISTGYGNRPYKGNTAFLRLLYLF